MKKILYLLKNNTSIPLKNHMSFIGGKSLKIILKSLVVFVTILFLLSPICFCTDDVKFKEQIKKEER